MSDPNGAAHLDRLLDGVDAALDRGRWSQAVALCDEILSAVRRDGPAGLDVYAATALADKGWALEKMRQPGEALAAYAELLARFLHSTDAVVRAQIAYGLSAKSGCLLDAELYDSAADSLTCLLNDFAGDADPEIQSRVSQARIDRARAFYEVERYDDAIADADEFLRGHFNDTTLVQRVRALHIKEQALFLAERLEEAFSVHEQVRRTPGALEDEDARPYAVASSFNRALTLEKLDRVEEARAAYAEVVARFGDEDSEAVARAREKLAELVA